MKKKARKPRAVESAADQVDRDLALSALIRKRAGQKIPKDELAALRRLERRLEEDARWRALTRCPKSVYLDMCARQTVQVHRHADTFGLPLRGRTVDISAVIGWLHQFLDDHGDNLVTDGQSQVSHELELLRAEQRRGRQIANDAALMKLIPREIFLREASRFATTFRDAHRRITRRFGNEAYEILREAQEMGLEQIKKYLVETLQPDAPNPLALHGETTNGSDARNDAPSDSDCS